MTAPATPDIAAARRGAGDREAAMAVALGRDGEASLGDEALELAARDAEPAHDVVDGMGIAQQPCVAVLASRDGGGRELAPEPDATVTERHVQTHAIGDLQPCLAAVGHGDRDGPVGALLADHRLVPADAKDEDPGTHGVFAAVGGDRTRSSILLAVAAAHGAHRAKQLMVDRLRDPGCVSGERHRPQDRDHEQDDGDVVDAGLAAIGRSRGAL